MALLEVVPFAGGMHHKVYTVSVGWALAFALAEGEWAAKKKEQGF